MVKLIGACVTLAACGSLGLTWAGLFEKRPRQLLALEGAVKLLETEMLFAATPMAQAMTEVAARCDSDVAVLFRHTAAELARGDGITAGEAWSKSLEDFFPGTALSDKDLQILKRFGSLLGASDREDQARQLEITRKQLQTAAIQAEAEAKRSAGMYKYLGFLGGLLVVLVVY